jgi:hypothetical protein
MMGEIHNIVYRRWSGEKIAVEEHDLINRRISIAQSLAIPVKRELNAWTSYRLFHHLLFFSLNTKGWNPKTLLA